MPHVVRTDPSASRPALVQAVAFAALVCIVVASRWMDHAPNATAAASAALFAGFFFRSVRLAIAAPIAAMLASDALIGGYHIGIMATVYASLALPVLAGRLLHRGTAGRRLGTGVACVLGGSVLFFMTTNLAVWAFSGYYPATGAGLAQCYSAALPFFRFTVMGDLFYSACLFGGYALMQRGATHYANRSAMLAA